MSKYKFGMKAGKFFLMCLVSAVAAMIATLVAVRICQFIHYLTFG